MMSQLARGGPEEAPPSPGSSIRLAGVLSAIGYLLIGTTLYELTSTGPPHVPVSPFVNLGLALIVSWLVVTGWRRQRTRFRGFPSSALLLLAGLYVSLVLGFWVYCLWRFT